MQLRTTDFAETTISLDPCAVEWKPSYGVDSPLQLSRSYDRQRLVLRRTRLSLLLELDQDGWEAGIPTVPVSPDGPKVFRLNTSKPLSYFGALVGRATIWAKGVESFPHDQTDHYFRCLLRLDADSLHRVLANVEGRQDAWFKQELRNASPEDDSSDDDGGAHRPAPPVAALPLANGEQLPGPVPVVDRAFVPWVRKLCHCGPGTERAKIYFGTQVRGSGQPSWLTCLHHAAEGCIRWRTTSDDQRRFCAAL